MLTMLRSILTGAVLGALLLTETVTGISGEDLFDTKSYEVRMEKGFKHLKAGRHNAAIREFEEAAAVNPDAEAYYYLGYVYSLKAAHRRGDRKSKKKAQENFALAYELDPDFKPPRSLSPLSAGLPAAAPGAKDVFVRHELGAVLLHHLARE